MGRRGRVVLLPRADIPLPGPLRPPNGGATGPAAVGPHAVLVLLCTCKGVLPLCHELSGRMDAGGAAANSAPTGRLSAVWGTARLRAAGQPPAGLLPHQAVVRERVATDDVGTRFGKQRPLPTGVRTLAGILCGGLVGFRVPGLCGPPPIRPSTEGPSRGSLPVRFSAVLASTIVAAFHADLVTTDGNRTVYSCNKTRSN